jgi:carbon-monoxide dehydrogenase large subunit
VDRVYTNKAPGGCLSSFQWRGRLLYQRAMDIMARKLGMDPAELRMKT